MKKTAPAMIASKEKLMWFMHHPTISPQTSQALNLAKAQALFDSKCLKEVLSAKPVLKKKTIPKRKKTMLKFGTELKPVTSLAVESVYIRLLETQKRFLKPKIMNRGILSGCRNKGHLDCYSNRCLDEIIKSTRNKAREVAKIRNNHKSTDDDSYLDEEELVRRRILTINAKS